MHAAGRGGTGLPSPSPGSSPGAARERGERLSRAERITASAEIRRLFQRGKRIRSRYFDVIVAASPEAFPRLGTVIPKHGNSVVRRNRLKRRVREVGRRDLLPALRKTGRVLDTLVRARPEAYQAEFVALREDLTRALDGVNAP